MQRISCFFTRNLALFAMALCMLTAPAHAATKSEDVVAATDKAISSGKKPTSKASSKATTSSKKGTSKATTSSKKGTVRATSSTKKKATSRATTKKKGTSKATRVSKKHADAKPSYDNKDHVLKLAQPSFSHRPLSLLSPSAGVASYMMDEPTTQAQLTPLLNDKQ